MKRGPAQRTLGSFMPAPLGALSRGPSIENQAASAKEAYIKALEMFEFERDLARSQRRSVNPVFGEALNKAYSVYDRLSAKASWTKASGEVGGSTFAPRGRWSRTPVKPKGFTRPP